jgi:hypothetical protein
LTARGTGRHSKAVLKAGAGIEEIMEILKISAAEGLRACNPAVPILAEELANRSTVTPWSRAPTKEQSGLQKGSSMSVPPDSSRSRRVKRAAIGLLAVLLLYLLVAYVLLPVAWKRYAHRHPAWEDAPRLTHTGNAIPGDPVNVALVGSEAEVKKVMLAAGWYPADPLTLKSCLEIAAASVLGRPDQDAPVSNLFLFGRKQDLAFEQPVGGNPRKRHHVRFWKWDQLSPDGRPVWFGAATYDKRVGLSYTTGQITHHIAPDVDAERDHLMRDLEGTGDMAEVYGVDGFHKTLEGRNGGGDPWHTDGNLSVAVLKPATPNSHP